MKSEIYTFREAMACLGLKSKSAFYLLEDKYPEAFVLMNQGSGPGAQYHKTTLDRFVMIREYFRNGNYEHKRTEPVANSANIGITTPEMAALWNEQYPDNQIELGPAPEQ